MKIKLIIAGVLAIALITTYWAFTHAFVEISIDNPAGSSASYTLTQQATGKSSIIISDGARIKRLVARGDYQITVKQSDTSYVTIVKTDGFLGTTSVTAHLSPEKARRFVGYQPDGCTYYTGQVLYSYTCGGAIGSLALHIPASANEPTYKQTYQFGSVIGNIEGIVRTKEGSLLLLHTGSSNGGLGAHIIYNLGDNGNLSNGTALTGSNPNTVYSIYRYGDSFVVFDSALNSILYYSSISAAPTTLSATKPSGYSADPYVVKIQGSSILALYSNSNNDGAPKGASDKNAVGGMIVVTQSGTSRQFSFNKQYAEAELCGSLKLCLLNNTQMDVYDIGGQTPGLLYSVHGVKQIEQAGSNVLIVEDMGVIELNIDSQEGFLSYSFGGYSYWGIQNNTFGYTLLLTNKSQQKVVLQIAPATPNSDSIDKKVLSLMGVPGITNVSIYGQYIFITPVLGSMIYDPANRIYTYDPAAKQAAAVKINGAVNTLGINKSNYTIIDTAN